VVTAPGADRPLGWTTTVAWEVNGGDLGLFQLLPHHVGVLSDGRLILLDDTNPRLHVLTPDGRLERSLSGAGEGPGELRAPSAITIDADTIVVVDPGRRGLVFWTDRDEVRTETFDPAFWGPALRRARGGSMYVRLPAMGAEVQELVLAQGEEMRTIATLTREPDRPATLDKCGLRDFPVSPLFARELLWDATENVIATHTASDYHITLHRPDGSGYDTLRRDLTPLTPNPALVAAEIGGETLSFSMLGGFVCELTIDELLEWRGAADPVPPIRGLVIIPSGELWVTRRSEAIDMWLVDVWTLDGGYRGTLSLDAGIPVAGLPSGRIVALGRDAFGEPVLRALEVERGRATFATTY
jgi:hypothetical protein